MAKIANLYGENAGGGGSDHQQYRMVIFYPLQIRFLQSDKVSSANQNPWKPVIAVSKSRGSAETEFVGDREPVIFQTLVVGLLNSID